MKYGNRHVEWRGIAHMAKDRSWVQCLTGTPLGVRWKELQWLTLHYNHITYIYFVVCASYKAADCTLVVPIGLVWLLLLPESAICVWPIPMQTKGWNRKKESEACLGRKSECQKQLVKNQPICRRVTFTSSKIPQGLLQSPTAFQYCQSIHMRRREHWPPKSGGQRLLVWSLLPIHIPLRYRSDRGMLSHSQPTRALTPV